MSTFLRRANRVRLLDTKHAVGREPPVLGQIAAAPARLLVVGPGRGHDSFISAQAVVDVANAPVWDDAPVNGTVELAGPEPLRLDELVRSVLVAQGDDRTVIADAGARYFGTELDDRSLTPGQDARIGPTRFQDWLGHSTTHDHDRTR